MHTKNLSHNIEDKTTTSPLQGNSTSHLTSAANNNNGGTTDGNTPSPGQKVKDNKVTSKFRKSWFGSGNGNGNGNGKGNGFINIPKLRRRSSGSENSHKHDRSASRIPGHERMGEGENDDDDGGGGSVDYDNDDENIGKHVRYDKDGRESVGTPMGTQEELDHYAYRRGLGEDVVMGLA